MIFPSHHGVMTHVLALSRRSVKQDASGACSRPLQPKLMPETNSASKNTSRIDLVRLSGFEVPFWKGLFTLKWDGEGMHIMIMHNMHIHISEIDYVSSR